MTRANLVPFPPQATVIALQWWNDGTGGDEAAAMRLARLLSDLEPRRRSDVYLAFCRRFDTPISKLASDTFLYCGRKFGVMWVQSKREALGHPDGSFGLWAGVMDELAGAWRHGRLDAHSVFTIEADGCPLRRDWIDRLLLEHRRTIEAGKRVTGCHMDRGFPHVNGSLIAHLSLWFDRPSLHHTPPSQAWDLFHAAVLNSEARPTTWIRNVYGDSEWSDASLDNLSRETAWLSSTKDTSAIEWAERTLVPKENEHRPEDVDSKCSRCGAGPGTACNLAAPGHRQQEAKPEKVPAPPGSCRCPDPYRCARAACPCPCEACSGARPRRISVQG